MSKSTKNIIVIIIMVIMLVCSYFTVKKISNKNIPSMTNNQAEVFNKLNEGSNNTNEENNANIDDSKKEDDSTRKNRGNRPNNMPNRPNGNNNFNFEKGNFNPGVRGNNTLFIILFGLESAIIGGCAVYLVLLNSNKLKDNKKS